LQYAITTDQKEAINLIADYYAKGSEITQEQWEEASKFCRRVRRNSSAAADAATYDATYVAAIAAAAAADAADAASAAYAAYAADAAADVADTAAYAADAADAANITTRINHYIAQSQKLLELLRECE